MGIITFVPHLNFMIMANKRDLKRNINNVLGEIIDIVVEHEKEPTADGDAIIEDAIATFDNLIARVNDRTVEDKKTHFKSINDDLESKGRALINRINKL